MASSRDLRKTPWVTTAVLSMARSQRSREHRCRSDMTSTWDRRGTSHLLRSLWVISRGFWWGQGRAQSRIWDRVRPTSERAGVLGRSRLQESVLIWVWWGYIRRQRRQMWSRYRIVGCKGIVRHPRLRAISRVRNLWLTIVMTSRFPRTLRTISKWKQATWSVWKILRSKSRTRLI